MDLEEFVSEHSLSSKESFFVLNIVIPLFFLSLYALLTWLFYRVMKDPICLYCSKRTEGNPCPVCGQNK